MQLPARPSEWADEAEGGAQPFQASMVAIETERSSD